MLWTEYCCWISNNLAEMETKFFQTWPQYRERQLCPGYSIYTVRLWFSIKIHKENIWLDWMIPLKSWQILVSTVVGNVIFYVVPLINSKPFGLIYCFRLRKLSLWRKPLLLWYPKNVLPLLEADLQSEPALCKLVVAFLLTRGVLLQLACRLEMA